VSLFLLLLDIATISQAARAKSWSGNSVAFKRVTILWSSKRLEQRVSDERLVHAAAMMIEAHGGRIQVESEEGFGATVRLLLPAQDA
jgi:hypothetical protein